MIRPAASLLYPLTASVLVLSACIVFVCSISSSRMLTKTSYKLLQSGRLGDSPHLDERASERVSERVGDVGDVGDVVDVVDVGASVETRGQYLPLCAKLVEEVQVAALVIVERHQWRWDCLEDLLVLLGEYQIGVGGVVLDELG